MCMLHEYSQEDQDRINAVPEKFNDASPFSVLHDDTVMEIEKDEAWRPNIGKLWTGKTWLTVSEARLLRDWLNKVIP